MSEPTKRTRCTKQSIMATGADASNAPVDNNNVGGGGGDGEDAPGEASLLVSEFPPPPYYYYRAAGNYRSAPSTTGDAGTITTTNVPTTYHLKPPEIPIDALSRGTRRAAAAAARARAEAERIRLLEEAGTNNDIDKTDAILGGITTNTTTDDVDKDGDVVAVFGEIVEDPYLVVPMDRCEDPKIVREEVKRLNRQVLQGFVKLVNDLVHNPMENKKTRDELSHNIFLMLQECNKFREHQAREILIELLEKQLQHRKMLIQELQEGMVQADALLAGGIETTTTGNEAKEEGEKEAAVQAADEANVPMSDQ